METLIDEMGGSAGAGEILELYLGQLESRCAAVLGAPDAPARGRAAHALGSPSSLVGAAVLALRCREIEVQVREGRAVTPEVLEGLGAECARVRGALEDLLPALAQG